MNAIQVNILYILVSTGHFSLYEFAVFPIVTCCFSSGIQ